ncbi:hypothetical protein E2K75_17860 [Escherichia coli]|nr:hypothetical protein E2K71_30575 [Escherichia coli]KAA0616346.1 hypothetical protein E2K75_17860 [Escherichia coli]KAA0647184.1 hypothetical protein E2K63_30590 [Escherichia coli]
MLPSEIMIWQPEFTDKILSRKPGAVHWKARLNEGVNPETMLEGVKRYAGWVSAMGNSGTQFVKQAVTFFGPDRHFEESWEVPAVSAARREDPYFKASYDNADYSQIPAGFRG